MTTQERRRLADTILTHRQQRAAIRLAAARAGTEFPTPVLDETIARLEAKLTASYEAGCGVHQHGGQCFPDCEGGADMLCVEASDLARDVFEVDELSRHVAALRAALETTREELGKWAQNNLRESQHILDAADAVLDDTDSVAARFVDVDSGEMHELLSEAVGSGCGMEGEHLPTMLGIVDSLLAAFKARRGGK